MRPLWAVLLGLVLIGCTGMPEGIQPVTGFEQSRYLGTWHEIARLDHSFERGLSAVTASYSLKDNGEIRVINRGFDAESESWKEAEGRAQFVDNPTVAHLKVSFFGPFFGSYVVFELGEEYDYAFISGYNTSYAWLLARTPQVSDEIKQRFERRLGELGFSTDELIWPETQLPDETPPGIEASAAR
ncbi:lipocalin family protein [Luminiphilus syltensis]|uniref:lipocalin family protein n=1 Tax=Luminiphilus syltensis TaxID=1341119 RepID=UPI00058B60FA|nr:lipocalin family protein [Luminiphilus syltensis]